MSDTDQRKIPHLWRSRLMDSVNVSSGIVAVRVLILDQGMILAAIANRACPRRDAECLHRSRKRAGPPTLDRPRGVHCGPGTATASHSARGEGTSDARQSPR